MKKFIVRTFKIILKAVIVLTLAFLIYAMGFSSGEKNVIENSVITIDSNSILIDYNGNVYEHIIE